MAILVSPQHEKIIRGLAVGLALVQYGREEVRLGNGAWARHWRQIRLHPLHPAPLPLPIPPASPIITPQAAETLIEQMSRDQDPILRYGAM